MRWKQLDWDTRFFGFNVIEIDSRDTPKSTTEIQQTLEKAKAKLAYWKPVFATETFSNHCIVLQTTMQKQVYQAYQVPLPRTVEVAEHVNRPPSDDLIELAFDAGHLSRFKIDSRIPETEFQKLYRLWIVGSCEGHVADTVPVATIDGMTAGFATGKLGTDNKDCAIGLIAVSHKHRKRGVGTALMASIDAYALDAGCQSITVTTQLENTAAISLYNRFEFERISTSYCHHFWRDQLG